MADHGHLQVEAWRINRLKALISVLNQYYSKILKLNKSYSNCSSDFDNKS